jgi:hypothetical protein
VTDAELCRLLVVVADSLERDGRLSFPGLIRQAARRIAELQVVESGPDHCPGCGELIVQPPTGRPRQWCGRGRCEGRKTPENVRVG